jgi:hypothetical protein
MAGAILAVMSEKDEQCRTLHAAIALARRLSTRVSVVGIPLRPPFGVTCSPVVPVASYSVLRQENIDRILQRCHELAQDVPQDVPVDYRVMPGKPIRVVDSLLECGSFGAVVMQDKGMGGPLMWRAVRRWRRQGIAVYSA